MKGFSRLSYRSKMLLAFVTALVLVAGAITLALTYAASTRAIDDNKAHLHLLTEQALLNFTASMDNVRQQLVTELNAKGVSSLMYQLRDAHAGDAVYYSSLQEVRFAVSQMLYPDSPYDYVQVCLLGGDSVHTGEAVDETADSLLARPELAQNNYSRSVWVREEGKLYIVRDVYNVTPFKRVGKVVARVRQEQLVTLGGYNETLHCTLLFYDGEGAFLTMTGESGPALAAEAAAFSPNGAADTVRMGGEEYYLSVKRGGDWTAAGMLPMRTLLSVRDAALRTGVAVGLLGALLGVLVIVMLSHRLTRQVRALVGAMDAVAAGDINREAPVMGGDDIAQLAVHFNTMTARMRELLTRIVQEETRKQQAEYQLLEYRYRSLQSQINPHFIYNAMETVNALAKLDGNAEICEVVQHISAYFRKNARNMQKRYVTVGSEIDSLRQYAYIYCHIHGSRLKTAMEYEEDVGDALLPTMILQPVLENALMHGVSATQGEALVSVTVRQEGDRLLICVCDNGKGMPAEVAARILSGRGAHEGEDRKSAGIGMSNVLQRLRLIYGDRAGAEIDSRPGGGTRVRIAMPLRYDMPDMDAE